MADRVEHVAKGVIANLGPRGHLERLKVSTTGFTP